MAKLYSHRSLLTEIITGALACVLILGQPVPAAAKDGAFLVISDIHFNPYHELDKPKFQELCALAAEEWPSFYQGLKQPVVKQGSDSNYALVVSALDAAAKRIPDPAFILYPGDFMGHDWQKTYDSLSATTIAQNPAAYREFTAKALQFLANEIQRRFPDTPFLPTLGNDDSFCQDYWIQQNGEFLASFGKIWQPLLAGAADPAAFAESFSDLGAYTADLPWLDGHELIVLNSVLWSGSYCDAYFDPGDQNCCACANAGAAPGNAQFTWLESALAEAKKDSKRVWLLMHVPPGLDSYKESSDGGSAAANMWTEEFTARYLQLIGEYREILHTSFAGHTHMDDYRVDRVDGVPVLLHKIIPAVSPIYGNNPSFQIYQNDPGSGAITNWQTHYLDLKSATGTSPTGIWSDEYDAGDTFGLGRFNAKTADALFRLIHEDPTGAHSAAYRLFYEVSASSIAEEDLSVYSCVILNATFAEFHRCLTGHGSPAPAHMANPGELRRLAGGLVPPK